MCSYKVVKVFFEVWGLQSKVESSVHRVSVQVMFVNTLVLIISTVSANSRIGLKTAKSPSLDNY